MAALDEVQRLLDAARAEAIAQFDRSQAYELDGSVTAAAWLRTFLHTPPKEAAERVRSARFLADRDATRAALSSALINYGHVRVIRRALEDLPVEAWDDAEAALLAAARRCHPERLAREVGRLRQQLLPEPEVSEDEQLVDRRYLRTSTTLDGMVWLEALLDPVAARVAETAIEAFLPRDGADVDPSEKRTMRQRRCDALITAFEAALAAGEAPTSDAGVRPHVSVLVDLSVLEDRLGLARGELDELDVSGEALRGLTCDAGISRVVTGGGSLPLDVGRETPAVSPAQRRALRVRDRGCRWPGCEAPWRWTEAHHVVHWAHGGPTDLSNLVALCWHHHHRVAHGPDGEWALHLARDGTLTCTNRIGSAFVSRPAGRQPDLLDPRSGSDPLRSSLLDPARPDPDRRPARPDPPRLASEARGRYVLSA